MESDSRIEDSTGLLANGAQLPDHPASSTGLKIVTFGKVVDDGNGTELHAGRLHENELRLLMDGHNGALGHLYLFAIRNNRIYHTRNLVTIDCLCEPVEVL